MNHFESFVDGVMSIASSVFNASGLASEQISHLEQEIIELEEVQTDLVSSKNYLLHRCQEHK